MSKVVGKRYSEVRSVLQEFTMSPQAVDCGAGASVVAGAAFTEDKVEKKVAQGCLGRQPAQVELKIDLARMFRGFDFELWETERERDIDHT